MNRTDVLNRSSVGRQCLATWMPMALILAAVLLASMPAGAMFLLISAVGSMAALVAAGIQILWLREFRLNWVLADGLMLGYVLGAFNSAARLELAGIPVGEYFGRPAEDLSTALAAVLLVCAVLFWLGGRMTPIRLNLEKLRSADAPMLWFGVLLVGAALVTGTLGYQGVSASDEGRVSILGQLAATAAPVLPAFTLLLQRKFRSAIARALCWPVMAGTLGALVPQGRRAMLYGVLLVILAFSLRGGRIRLFSWKTAMIVIPACGLLYAGNVFFYAMRVSSYQAGGAKTSLPGLTEKAVTLLQHGGNGSLGDQVERNLRDRTFVIRYLSDLLHASWQREALHGEALLFCVESAIPSVLFPDKDRIRAIGMEENLANPQFGLYATDEANSVLTTGVSDFGIAGMFLYPVVLIILMQVFLKAVAGTMPEAARLFLILCVLNTLWQTELSTGGYFVLCRNLLLLSVPLIFLAKLGAYLRAPSPASEKYGLGIMGTRLNIRLLMAAAFTIVVTMPTNAAVSLNLADFDAACGQAQHNCRAAFQKAFDAAEKAGGGTVNLPAGTFFVDFPEIPSDTTSGPPLQKGSFLIVPSGVTAAGHTDGQGAPDTIIEWKTTSVPLFIFANSANSAMSNLHFRFTGTAPARYPYGDTALLRGLGFNPTFPHTNQMSGGNYELSSVIMLFGSERCSLSNLVFDSATHDNQHAFGFAINLKGKGLALVAGTGGITSTAADNHVSGITIHDFVMGLMIAGQENLVIENVTADHRASSAAIAPGHLIYLTGTALFDAKGAVEKRISSRNVTVRNIREGSDTYSNLQALGTLAIKSVDGGVFDAVESQHPAGLIQTLQSDRNLRFENLRWTNEKDYCAEGGQRYCATPVIESAASAEGDPPMQGLSFHNIRLESAAREISVNLLGADITADGFTIRTKPTFRKDQTAPGAVFSLREASNARITNFTYIPVLDSFDRTAKYNQPFVCWGACSNVHADVTVKWPKAVPLPSQSERVISPGFQVRKDGDNNSVTSHIEETTP